MVSLDHMIQHLQGKEKQELAQTHPGKKLIPICNLFPHSTVLRGDQLIHPKPRERSPPPPMATQLMDKETFCTLILEHQNAMYRAARSILSSPEDVEDAVQEAVCAAFAHRGDLRDPQRFKPWLLRIVVNTCYEICRKQKKVVDLSQVEGVLEAPNADPTESISLWQAVLALPESLRTAVTLFYYEDCTVAQIAQILHISQGAVKLRLNRGRARLRTILQED